MHGEKIVKDPQGHMKVFWIFWLRSHRTSLWPIVRFEVQERTKNYSQKLDVLPTFVVVEKLFREYGNVKCWDVVITALSLITTGSLVSQPKESVKHILMLKQ